MIFHDPLTPGAEHSDSARALAAAAAAMVAAALTDRIGARARGTHIGTHRSDDEGWAILVSRGASRPGAAHIHRRFAIHDTTGALEYAALVA